MKKILILGALILTTHLYAGECSIMNEGGYFGTVDDGNIRAGNSVYSFHNTLVGTVKYGEIRSDGLVGTVSNGEVRVGNSDSHYTNRLIGTVGDDQIREGTSVHYSNDLVAKASPGCTLEELGAAALLLVLKVY